MRKALTVLVPAIALALAALGCGGPNPSSSPSPHDGGASLDGHLEQNPGQMGSSCATACDCQPGLSCVSGSCGAGGAAYYCCESSSCPAGSMCQSASGSLSTCGGSGSGGSGSGGSGSGGSGSGGSGSGGGVPGLPGLGDGGIGGGGGLPGLGDGGLGGGGGACGLVSCQSDSDCTSGLVALLGCTACDTATGKCK